MDINLNINKQNFISDYLSWLKENSSQLELENNITEITMPYLDRRNDHIQIYIIKSEDDTVTLSDYGYTISELKLSGMNLDTSKRKELIQFNLNRYGVQYSSQDDSLFVKSSIQDIPMNQHKLIQAMLDIDDMFYTASANVNSIFLEEVTNFFDNNNIYYTTQVNFIGKSGYQHNYDFVLQRNSRHNERLVKVLNTPSKDRVQNCIFSWEDTKDKRIDSKKRGSDFIVIMNDQNSKISDATAAFKNYGIIPMAWSNINNNIRLLA